jgi:hypothetical protein
VLHLKLKFVTGLAASFILVVLATGCITEGKEQRKIKKLGSPPPNARITELHLWTMPVGINLDGRPGPDGFSLKVYASGPDYPKPIPLREGVLEILM